MPSYKNARRAYKPTRDKIINWDNFQGGWNDIFRPTELKPNELAQADNIILTGEGVPTGRWGSQNYNLAGTTGSVRMLTSYYQGATNELLFITDQGYLAKKLNASYSVVNGASFASGYNAEAVQLGGNVYIVGGGRELVKYNGTSLIPYPTISAPTGLLATNLSGATGFTNWSWRVTAKSQTGETIGSTAYALSSLPFDLTKTAIKLTWNAVSTASGVLTGYEIYRGSQGDESYLTGVDNRTTSYIDTGSTASDTILPPTADTTGGPKGKYILKFDDRIIVAGIDGDSSLVMISGRYPYQDRFNWSDGGGYVRIDPDGGDDITGIGISGGQSQGGGTPASILIFKKNSTHQLVLRSVSIGNYIILDPQTQLLAPTGASNHKTIIGVENNTFYFGRNGLYNVGQEANFLNQIRTKELSARIRTYIRNLSDTDRNNACAEYIDNKYLLSFPTKKEMICYDYERGAFTKWITPFGVTEIFKYYDSVGAEKWLAGTDNTYIKEFDRSLKTDSGTAIKKTIRTRKEDFGDWTVMKTIKLFHVLFRNVSGNVQVNINIEGREGITSINKSFQITGSIGTAGWGTDLWGGNQWGLTQTNANLVGEEIIRYTQLFKQARTVQVEIISSGNNSNFEFLATSMTAQPMEQGSLNADTRV